MIIAEDFAANRIQRIREWETDEGTVPEKCVAQH